LAVARRPDRLNELIATIGGDGGTAIAVQANVADRAQATAAVQQAIDAFGRIDTLVNNAGLMLLGVIEGADPDEWDRMLKVNVTGVLNMTHAALPHLFAAAERAPRHVADAVNVSSVAGRRASKNTGVYNVTKFGVNAFTESLRQEVTQRHVRVGVIEPGGVRTELGSHNRPEIQQSLVDPFYATHHPLSPEDLAESIAFMVTRPRHAAVNELWVMPTEQL
jgi:NADP-dependent 3-hydroxy acid dehydrogenase YdfG